MEPNLFQAGWTEFDAEELLTILFEYIGKPGQYSDHEQYPNNFYLPLAGPSSQLKLTFSDDKKIVSIKAGPAFDAARWNSVVQEIENAGPLKTGRDISFCRYRVNGSWRGARSGIQILPPPNGAPLLPYIMGDHPFMLEFPLHLSGRWPIANFRRWRAHHRFTSLLNVLLLGGTTYQRHRSKHFWAVVPSDKPNEPDVKWLQEMYFANFGAAVLEEPSAPDAELLQVIESQNYYATYGHDGGALRVPDDLDDSICRYLQLSKENRGKFDRAAYWMDMASRQWEMSFSAVFASLSMAIEALAERDGSRPTTRFKKFIETYSPGAVSESRREKMYALRSGIVHGSDLMEIDQDAGHSWAPPEWNEKELMDELWGVSRVAARNWLKSAR